jgi:hypothetical protein
VLTFKHFFCRLLDQGLYRAFYSALRAPHYLHFTSGETEAERRRQGSHDTYAVGSEPMIMYQWLKFLSVRHGAEHFPWSPP